MKLYDIFKFVMALFFISGLSGAISVSCSSGDGGGVSTISANYDLDSSTVMTQSTTLGDGKISSIQSIEGGGSNEIAQTAANENASVSSSISSIGILSSTGSSYASTDAVSVGHNTQTAGQSECAVSGTIASVSASQNAGVLDGFIASSQIASAKAGTVNALQAWNIAGALGYADGDAKLPDNIVKISGGLNGLGGISGFIGTKASKIASASGSFQADSLGSKAYSAAKSTSSDGESYSYLSSADQLTSSLSASADGHVTSNQDLNANGDVLLYAISTSDDSSSKRYDSCGEVVSGSIFASAGSPEVIETNLAGDIQITSAGLVPTPGSWVWNGLGGAITSNLYQLQADGKSHIFAKGADNGLWDNVDGDWRGLGGIITSDPFAVKDGQGKIHVLARGGDGALWDRVLDGGWVSQGGAITSNPSGALSQDNKLKVVVKGWDDSLWLKDLTTGEWSGLGGKIASNPQVVFDKYGKMHALVRGADSGLWDNVDGVWQSRGGSITSDTKAAIDPFNPEFVYTSVRGADGSLWYNALDTSSNIATWKGLGGSITGTPAPVMDTDGVLHNFVRGGYGGLWDNANGEWYNLGGAITSDPNAMRDKDGKLHAAVVGGGNGLLVNTVGIDLTPTTLVGPIACDYKTIRDAVESMDDGSTIKVLSGIYPENVVIDKSLRLLGAGVDKTIVDGGQTGSVFTIGKNNVNADVTLSDMTIRNGKADRGGGIRNLGKAAITNCIISGNTAATYGGGIFNEEIGKATVTSSTLSGNMADWGGGIFTYGTVTIASSTFSGNSARSNGGAGIFSEGTVTITGSTLTGNRAATHGGGIYNDKEPTDHVGDGTLTMTDCTISGNTAGDHAGGIFNEGTSKATITNSRIIDNTAVHGGGISNVVGGDLRITDSTISGNKAGWGGGFFNYDQGKLFIGGTTQVVNNQATTGEGGGIYTGNSLVTLDGTGVAIKLNKAHQPVSQSSWYVGWGVYYVAPTTTGGFNPATQVTGNTKI